MPEEMMKHCQLQAHYNLYQLETVAKELDITVYPDSFVNIVTVDAEEYAKLHFNKAIKKTLTIPQWLNESATAAGINFSQVLQEALLQKIK